MIIEIQKNKRPSHCVTNCELPFRKITNMEWQTMLPKKVFIFLHEKIIFHFPSAQNGFFVKDLPNNCCKIGPNQLYKILGQKF